MSNYEEMANQEADDIQALEPKYDCNHEHYYCYLRDCTIEDLRAFATHRELPIKDDYPATLLVAMLRQDDQLIKTGKGIPCKCCPNPTDEEDRGHYGCEDCPPHYDKKDSEFLKSLTAVEE